MSTPTPKKTLAARIRALRWQGPAAWAAVILATYLHSLLLFNIEFTPDTVGWLFPLLLAAPGLLTMTLVPGGFRRWYRWAAIYTLFLTTYPEALPAVLLVGESWALHRHWVTEAVPGRRTIFQRSAAASETAAPARPRFGLRSRKPKTA